MDLKNLLDQQPWAPVPGPFQDSVLFSEKKFQCFVKSDQVKEAQGWENNLWLIEVCFQAWIGFPELRAVWKGAKDGWKKQVNEGEGNEGKQRMGEKLGRWWWVWLVRGIVRIVEEADKRGFGKDSLWCSEILSLVCFFNLRGLRLWVYLKIYLDINGMWPETWRALLHHGCFRHWT